MPLARSARACADCRGAAHASGSAPFCSNSRRVVRAGVVTTGSICKGSPIITPRRARHTAPEAACGVACLASSTSTHPRLAASSDANMRPIEAKVVEATGTSRKNKPQSSGDGARSRRPPCATAPTASFTRFAASPTKVRCGRTAATKRASRASRNPPPFHGLARCSSSSGCDQNPRSGAVRPAIAATRFTRTLNSATTASRRSLSRRARWCALASRSCSSSARRRTSPSLRARRASSSDESCVRSSDACARHAAVRNSLARKDGAKARSAFSFASSAPSSRRHSPRTAPPRPWPASRIPDRRERRGPPR